MCLTADYISIPIYNVNDVFFKLRSIPNGEYSNSDFKFKITNQNEDIKTVKIDTDQYSFFIKYYKYGYDIIYKNKSDSNFINDNYELIFSNSLNNQINYVNIKYNDKLYILYKNLIKNNHKSYIIEDNTIKIYINNRYYCLEYDFKENRIYIYISKKEIPTLKNDYIKIEDTKDLKSIINIINNSNQNNYSKIQELLKDTSQEELIELVPNKNIILPNDNVLNSFKEELLQAYDIYRKYNNKLTINNKVLEEVNTFIDYLIEHPIEAKVNKLENYIKNSDMNDTRELKYIRREIDLILKEKKKNIKKLKKEVIT